MTRSFFFLASFLAPSLAALAPVLAQADGRPLPSPEALEALGGDLAHLVADADRMTVFRVGPRESEGGAPDVAGYPVLEEKTLDADPGKVRRVKEGLFHADAYTDRTSNCFGPHHAIRLVAGEAVATLLVSFDCYQIRWVEGTRTVPIRTKGPLLDALEAALGKERSPEQQAARERERLEAVAALLGEGAVGILAGAERIAVYRIAPELVRDGDRLEGHPILATRVLEADAAAAAALRGVLLDPETYGGAISGDFAPRHAVVATRGEESVAILVSMESKTLQVRLSGEVRPVPVGEAKRLLRAMEKALE